MADMNSVNLTGRIIRQPELKYSQAGKAFAKFSIAVNGIKKEDVDFLNCIAWEKTAEIIAEYCEKGSQVAITGRIKTGSYENKEGVKVNTTDVIVNQITLIGGKKKDEGSPTDEDEKMPF